MNQKLKTFLRYAPEALLLLYTILLFFLYFAPVILIDFGNPLSDLNPPVIDTLPDPVRRFHVYKVIEITYLSQLHASMICLLIFAIVGLLLFLTLFIMEAIFYRKKKSRFLSAFWKFFPLAFYFIFFVIACTLYGQVIQYREILQETVTVGAFPTLLLVFTILFFLLHVISCLLPAKESARRKRR